MNVNRKDFLVSSAAIAGAATLARGKTLEAKSAGKDLTTFAAPALSKIRVGIVGLGMRGTGAVGRLSKIKDVEIAALCDLREFAANRAQKKLTQSGRPPAKLFFGTEDAWKKMVELDLDLIYIVTPWRWHTPMAVYAMENGKHAVTEVPSATTIEECWQLVDTAEKTGKHMMQLENCCYDFFEMQTLNMVRQGVFGELTHVEGAYLHDLCSLIAREKGGYQGMWRFKQNVAHDGNVYPTHGLGPIAQCLNINRGNKFSHLVSMSSQEAAYTEWAKENNRNDMANLKKYRGDMNCTLIKCENGETILVKHDVSTPRPYSRIHSLQGSKGMARKWPTKQIAFDHKKWLNEDEMKAMEAKYQHPLTKTMGELARKVGGHGGMDFIMDYRLMYCLKNGLPLDTNAYDAAAWSAVTPLGLDSVAKKSRTVDVPDFTRGKWKTNKPLEIVNVKPELLPVIGV